MEENSNGSIVNTKEPYYYNKLITTYMNCYLITLLFKV